MNGKTFIPELDILLCDVRDPDPTAGSVTAVSRIQIYTTEKGAFYMICKVGNVKKVKSITKDEAEKFMNDNAAYIVTANYVKVYGEPERG